MQELLLFPTEAFLCKTLTNNLDLLEEKYSEMICSICGSLLAEVIVVYRFKSIKKISVEANEGCLAILMSKNVPVPCIVLV